MGNFSATSCFIRLGRSGLLLLIALLSLPSPWDKVALATEKHRYLQQTGDERYHFDWILDHSEGYLLRAVSDAEEHRTVMDDAMETQRWMLTNRQDDTSVEARREGNLIVLQGRFHGKGIDKVLAIDDAPWFQSLSSSLRSFLSTPQQTTEFWTLRPDKLTVHKVRASKKGVETLDLGLQQIEADRVEVGLTGIASLLGRGRYWFRTSDRLLLHYQGPGGLPGVPATTITLQPPF